MTPTQTSNVIIKEAQKIYTDINHTDLESVTSAHSVLKGKLAKLDTMSGNKKTKTFLKNVDDLKNMIAELHNTWQSLSKAPQATADTPAEVVTIQEAYKVLLTQGRRITTAFRTMQKADTTLTSLVETFCLNQENKYSALVLRDALTEANLWLRDDKGNPMPIRSQLDSKDDTIRSIAFALRSVATICSRLNGKSEPTPPIKLITRKLKSLTAADRMQLINILVETELESVLFQLKKRALI